jgi:putative peptidoglycan lipid II flippase
MQILKYVTRLGSGNLSLTLTNLARDVAIATIFGIAADVDAFFLAIMIPVFLITTTSSAFRSAVVPVLEKCRYQHGDLALANMVTILFKKCIFIAFVIGGFLMLISAWLSQVIGGVQLETQGLIQSILLYVIPVYMLSSVAILMEGPLQVRCIYFLPSLLKALIPLGMALGAFLSGESVGVISLCYGGLLGAILQFIIVVILLYKNKLLLTKMLYSSLPLNEIKYQFSFLLAGVSVAYMSPLIDQWMSSWLGAGEVSTLGYANRLIVGISSLTTGTLAPVILAHFSKNIARDDYISIKSDYHLFVQLTLWLGVGIALVVWLFAQPMVSLLYEYGEFGASDRQYVSEIMQILALQIPLLLTSTAAYTLISALSMNKVFIPLGITLIITNVIGNYVFMSFFELKGIALATVLNYALSLVIMNLFLFKKKVIDISSSMIKHGFIAGLFISVVILGRNYLPIEPGLSVVLGMNLRDFAFSLISLLSLSILILALNRNEILVLLRLK